MQCKDSVWFHTFSNCILKFIIYIINIAIFLYIIQILCKILPHNTMGQHLHNNEHQYVEQTLKHENYVLPYNIF